MRGQTPGTLLIGCSDSRVDPAILTDSAPGDLFVVRNVANLVPPYETTGRYHGTSAALEFAVCNLHVHNIIVLGHSHCGGINALLDGYGENDEGEGYIAPGCGSPPRPRRGTAALAGRQSRIQAAGLRTGRRANFADQSDDVPFIRQRVEEGAP